MLLGPVTDSHQASAGGLVRTYLPASRPRAWLVCVGGLKLDCPSRVRARVRACAHSSFSGSFLEAGGALGC